MPPLHHLQIRKSCKPIQKSDNIEELLKEEISNIKKAPRRFKWIESGVKQSFFIKFEEGENAARLNPVEIVLKMVKDMNGKPPMRAGLFKQ
jgi:hypothetical protein